MNGTSSPRLLIYEKSLPKTKFTSNCATFIDKRAEFCKIRFDTSNTDEDLQVSRAIRPKIGIFSKYRFQIFV